MGDEGWAGFDWDTGNREKCQRHGVSVSEIESLFQRPLSIFPATRSSSEERFVAIGTNTDGRHVFLVFTRRGRDGALFLRPISARYMHQKEIEHYEKAAKAQER